MTAQWPFAGCWILLLAEMMTIALLIATYRSSGVKRRPADLFGRKRAVGGVTSSHRFGCFA
jgi:hypothetical protein